MKLDLEAKTKEQELVKAYLAENASEVLAEKINNGVRIEKDGKTLVNKKTLDGFMKYASDEARKLATNGANCACVEDKVVFGWAIHYFEEDSIEETLYNEDGTEYKPAPKFTPAKVKNVEPEKPKQQQISLFEFMDSEEKEETLNTENSNIDNESEKLTKEEICEFNEDMDEPKSLLDKIEDELQTIDTETGEILSIPENKIVNKIKTVLGENIQVR